MPESSDLNKHSSQVDTRRVFKIERPTYTNDDLLADGPLATQRSAKYLELFYNIIMGHDGLELPDHLRPITYALADSAIEQMMVIILPGSGKSQLTDIIYPLWEFGLDPSTTIIGASAAENLLTQFMQKTMSIIEHNSSYKEIFPNTLPDKDVRWSAAHGMYLQRPEGALASASYAVFGSESKSITGKHARILIGDDLHDKDNSSSSTLIDKLEEWYYFQFLGRQDPTGSRMILVGRRWADDDLYGRQKKSGDYLTMELPAIRDEGIELYYDVRIPANLACVFNDYKARDTYEDIKIVYGEDPKGFFWTSREDDPPSAPGKSKYKEATQIRRNKPAIFEIVYQGRPEKAGYIIFRKDDFMYYSAPEHLQDGRNYEDVIELLDGCELIIQSWDTAFSAQRTSDPSCCETAGLYPCRKSHRQHSDDVEIPFHYDIIVFDELHKRMDFADLTPEASSYYSKWTPWKVLVEKSAVGIPLIQDLAKYNVPVEGVIVQHTSKKSRAINGAKAGSAQGWFRQGRVSFPFRPILDKPDENAIEFVKQLENELIAFTGSGKEVDDRVDALIQLINFAIDLGVVARDMSEGWRTPEEVDLKIRGWKEKENPFMAFQVLMTKHRNPFEGNCGYCKSFDDKSSFCNIHKIKVSTLHSCTNYESKEPNKTLLLRII